VIRVAFKVKQENHIVTTVLSELIVVHLPHPHVWHVILVILLTIQDLPFAHNVPQDMQFKSQVPKNVLLVAVAFTALQPEVLTVNHVLKELIHMSFLVIIALIVLMERIKPIPNNLDVLPVILESIPELVSRSVLIALLDKLHLVPVLAPALLVIPSLRRIQETQNANVQSIITFVQE